ncbi:MAG: hypothetical protein ACRD32_07200, partial [Nitrososphaerales archaeon]
MTEKNVNETERIKEGIEIRDVKINNSKLNITLANTGGLPAKLVRMWVTDETGYSQTRYDVASPIIVDPKESVVNIGQGTIGSLSLPAQTTKSYTAKAITERGNIVSFKTVAGSQAYDLQLLLTTIPPSVVVGQDTTILLTVINNMYDAQAVHDISPTLGTPVASNCGPGYPVACPTLQQIGGPGPVPASVESLPRGSTATFTWKYNIGQSGTSSSAGAKVTFTATLGGQSASAELTVSQISIDSVPFSSLSGTLTIKYESLQWKQNGASCPWQIGWRIPTQGQGNGWTSFRVIITNHDPNNDLEIDRRSVFFLDAVDGTANKVQFFVVSAVQATCDPSATPTAYTYDAFTPSGSNPLVIPNNGVNAIEVIFAAKDAASNNNQKLPSSGAVFQGNFVMFGRLVQDG